MKIKDWCTLGESMEVHVLKECVWSEPPEAAERLFDLVDSFAESAKRKAAVWPLQIILLILCPEITQTISKETVEDSKANKVGWKDVFGLS